MSRSTSRIEIFERDCKFQASHPPRPFSLWGILKVKIEIFKRDCCFQAGLNISSELFSQDREEKSVHYHHRKKIIWGTFLSSKQNFPGRWWIQKPYENQENHIYHRNLSSVVPIFFGKEKFCSGAGQCVLSLSQSRFGPKGERSRLATGDWIANHEIVCRKRGRKLSIDTSKHFRQPPPPCLQKYVPQRCHKMRVVWRKHPLALL